MCEINIFSFVFWLSDLILVWIYACPSLFLSFVSMLLCSEHTCLQLHLVLGCAHSEPLAQLAPERPQSWCSLPLLGLIPPPAQGLTPCATWLWPWEALRIFCPTKFSHYPILFPLLITTLFLTVCVAVLKSKSTRPTLLEWSTQYNPRGKTRILHTFSSKDSHCC